MADPREQHPTVHDRLEAVKRSGATAAAVVGIVGALGGIAGDAHALQQAAIDDPTGTTYRQEVERQREKQWAEHRKVLDEQRAGTPQLRETPARETREKDKPRARRERRHDRDR